jgi:hypothetical protein
MDAVGRHGGTSTGVLDMTDQQPFGWLAQFTATYAAQRLSGMTVIMTTYTGVGQPCQPPIQALMDSAGPLGHHSVVGIR